VACYINATSTCDCTFRASFAGQSVSMLVVARVKTAQEQRIGVQVVEIFKVLESLSFLAHNLKVVSSNLTPATKSSK
jgi:hypothetical protein